jgi:glucan 1,3-beta-glucosidase
MIKKLPVVGSCDALTIPIAEWSPERRNEARKFIEAQLDTYEKSNGWIFWTAKTEVVPGNDNAWDMGLLIDNGVFPQPLTDRLF